MSTAAKNAQRSRLAVPRDATFWAIGALTLALVLQFTLVLHRAINWDEFWFYSQVEDLARGRLSLPLQTLHTRVFAWILAVPGTNVDRIIAARVAMFGCELVIAAIIASLTRRFTDRLTGLLAALCYVSIGFVFQHGYEFRTDPITTMLLMMALWVVFNARMSWFAAAMTGLIVGTAGMFTVKIVLYAPVFLTVIWWRWRRERQLAAALTSAGIIGGVALATFAVLYFLHSRGIVTHDYTRPQNILNDAGTTMFSTVGFYALYALKELLISPIQSLLILATPWIVWRSNRSVEDKICLTGLYLPITTLIFYHNTAPYYYTFMLPPVIVASSIGIAAAARRFGAPACAGLLLASAAIVWFAEHPGAIDKQRTLLRAADAIFPTPVAYFDFCGFLSHFPKANLFMTPWGIGIYKSGGWPSVRETLAHKAVPLILADDPMYVRALATREDSPEFLPRDLAAMRANYVHFWGPFWLAGKDVPDDDAVHREEFLVPGPYTVRDAAIVVDGVRHAPGAVIRLDRGVHTLRAIDSRKARLIWGERLKEPSYPPPRDGWWVDF